MNEAEKLKVEKAKAEAKEAARIQQINKQIKELSEGVSACNAVIVELTALRSRISGHKESWVGLYNRCKSSEITKEVVVKNIFEGKCAKSISEKFPKAVKEMEKNKARIDNIITGLDAQITKLWEYMNSLNKAIGSLRATVRL